MNDDDNDTKFAVAILTVSFVLGLIIGLLLGLNIGGCP
jgi:hypothetical protein